MPQVSVSILFATFKREEILRNTLDALTALDKSDFVYEVIVVDNACEEKIANLIASYKKNIPITYLSEQIQGKNSAMLTGLKIATGEIVAFIDDDIIVSSNWLNELVAGVALYPDYDLFGGKILPYLSSELTDHANLLGIENDFIKSAYGIADWKLPEGPITTGKIWGGNMAIRRRVFDAGVNFDPNIGPAGSNYAMSGETEFLERAVKAGFKGIYLPKAIVHHQIRQEQLNLSWLKARAFRYGRGMAIRNPSKIRRKFFGVPFYHLKKYLILWGRHFFLRARYEDSYLRKLFDFYSQKGFVYQSWMDRKRN